MREIKEQMNKFTKSGLIRLVVALKKVCNHQDERIKRLEREIYSFQTKIPITEDK